MLNYSKMTEYKKSGKSWKETETVTDITSIDCSLLYDLYWNYIVKAGHIKKIVHDFNTITVYHNNGYKTVYSK